MAGSLTPKRLERHRDWTLPQTPPRKRGEIEVADGFGVTVRVNRGQLVVFDGVGRDRRERRYGRGTSNLSRVIVLGGSGTLSLDALRWLGKVGASLACIDRDHNVLVTSGPTRSEANLRRAQALAPFNDNGLKVAKALLGEKLDGQRQLLDRLNSDPYPQRVLERSIAALESADSIQDAVAGEAEAAAAYWSAWADVEVRFQPAEQRRVPDEWRRFGTRTSPIGGGPRMAVNPAGALLNYLYALLEAEARLACLTLGLDPALAIVHADIRGRDSLPLDLMEAVRPSVDRYPLALLRDRVFRASDFHETQRGNCRLLAPLTHELAETLPALRKLIAPVAERVAGLLLERGSSPLKLATPLTESNRRADRARRSQRPDAPAEPKPPLPCRRCKRCGGELPNRDRVYCDACLPHYQRDLYQAYARTGREAVARQRAGGSNPRTVGLPPSGVPRRRRGNASSCSNGTPLTTERSQIPRCSRVRSCPRSRTSHSRNWPGRPG